MKTMETFNLRNPIKARIAKRIAKWGRKLMTSRPADFVIGKEDDPYLMRWWVLPRNKFFNVYLHLFMRSDDDRALHDHPWWNASFVLDGGYFEHMPKWKYMNPNDPFDTISVSPDIAYKLTAPGMSHEKWLYVGLDMQQAYNVRRWQGDLVFRTAENAHRVELMTLGGKPIMCMSLFFTGPRIREWGFHCKQGWVHFKDFISVRPGGNDIGKGCDQ